MDLHCHGKVGGEVHREVGVMWPVRTTLLILAAVALGCALQFNEGRYSTGAIVLLAITCMLVAIALFLPRKSVLPASSPPVSLWLRIAMIALIGIYLAFGIRRLHRTLEPFMDVFDFQRESCSALAHGKNPYAMTMPDIYGEAGGWVYAPQLRQNGRLSFGFPYMPLTLAWDCLGQLLAPDFRYANLIAMAIAGAMIWMIDRSWLSALAAALLLATPSGFYIVEKGWTEPLSIALLAATVFCLSRKSKLTPVALGLLIASKQYCVLLVPLMPLIAPMNRRFILMAFGTAILVTLPLVVINPLAFWHSAVALQFIQPFRDDSLSFAAFLARHGGPHVSGVIAILAALALTAFCTLRRQSFALSLAAVFLLFFSVNKQAFGNYYLFVIAAICCAIPLMRTPANVR